MKRILVPTDFSEEANNALTSALSLANVTKSEILLLHVIEDPHVEAFRTIGESHYDPMDNVYVLKLIERTKSKLEDIVNESRFADIEISYKIDIGNSYTSIIEHIAKHESSLIVMGTKGVSGLEEILVGSVADKVVRQADCPVITVKQCKDLTKIKNIVYATDLKPEQEQIIDHLKRIQSFFDAKLHIIKVYDSIWMSEKEVKSRIEEFAEYMKLENYTSHVVKDADESEAIMDYAAEKDADMIAMGAHDRVGLLYLIAGQVSKHVINHAHRPIWTKSIK